MGPGADEGSSFCHYRFFLRAVGLNRVYAHHAAGRVMQKCGRPYEGTMRHACRCNLGQLDRVNYAILADDILYPPPGG